MDHQFHSDPRFTRSTTCDPESSSSSIGMFSRSRNFTVKAKNLTNITYATAPSIPSDFRMIRMEDVDLRREIRVDERRGVVNYQLHGPACVRRVHSAQARIDGQRTRVTVAMYQGDGAEEEWRDEIEKYMSMRHPNIIQICGASSSGGIHATLFNDDLIPLQPLLDRYRDLHFSTVYIYACCSFDFSVRKSEFAYLDLTLSQSAYNYIYSAFQQVPFSSECRKWIRCSTGRLCAELTRTGDTVWLDLMQPEFPHLSGIHALSARTGTEAINMVIESLTLEQYHVVVCWNLRRRLRVAISASTAVDLGAVCHCSPSLLEDSAEIAFLSDVETDPFSSWTRSAEVDEEEMPNGWTRYLFFNLAEVVDADLDGESFGVDLGSTPASYESEYLHFSGPEKSDSFIQSSRNDEDIMPAPSPAFKILANFQLALILFLALFWTYNHVSVVIH
ncbi:hypothetical protein MSAN_02132000 [Mycena sanguinolenta]|uniref:Uncharacterized protein n=1 Tax=Mycena sanguinolenta TaxID=230812 RepID=A0A8H6XFQ0_9AGAR|nr:hypothetical protein MSAN_02132000 [Mycena sanguinolenta]